MAFFMRLCNQQDYIMIISKPAGKGNGKLNFTSTDRAYYRREKSESVSDVLKSAALAANDETALALAERMRQCSLKTNHHLAKDLTDASGECFDGFGNLWGCGSKLCHSCMTRAESGNRKQARQVLENTKLVRREYFCYLKQKRITELEQYRFITLTMPKVKLSCINTLNVLRRSWELFRKLDFTKNYFNGFVKSTEFTVRPDDRYHAHLHLLAVSVFIPEKLIKKYWGQCVKTAFAEFGVKFQAKSVVVNLQKVDSIDAALNEVCKYITKSESWEQIPKAHLLEIANVRRFPRMFELTGRLKKTARRIREQREIEKQIQMQNGRGNTGADYVHKNDITDGDRFQKSTKRRANWRDLVKKNGLNWYLKELETQVTEAMRMRRDMLIKKYPLATFTDLTGFVWHDPNLEFIDEIPKERREIWETSTEFLAGNGLCYPTRTLATV
jgi:hypothetical protein